MARPLSDVHFTADDGVDAGFLGVVVELNGAEKVTVIRDRHGRRVLLDRAAYKLFDTTSAVEQRVVCVGVEMNEPLTCHSVGSLYGGTVSPHWFPSEDAKKHKESARRNGIRLWYNTKRAGR